MLNKKRRSKKALIVSLSLLTCVSLAGVGFASFIIGSTNKVEPSVSVTLGSVTDKDYKLELKASETGYDVALSFDAPSSNTNTNTYVTGTGSEDMDFCIIFTLTGANPSSDLSGIKVTLTDGGSMGTLRSQSADNINYDHVIPPYVSGTSYTISGFTANSTKTNLYNRAGTKVSTSKSSLDYTVSVSGNVYTYTLTGTFIWGNVYNNANPVNLTSESEDTMGIAALKSFGKIGTTSTNAPTVSISIEPTLKTASQS